MTTELSFISPEDVSSETVVSAISEVSSTIVESLVSSETSSTASSTEASTASVDTSSAALTAPMKQQRRTKNIATNL